MNIIGGDGWFAIYFEGGLCAYYTCKLCVSISYGDPDFLPFTWSYLQINLQLVIYILTILVHSLKKGWQYSNSPYINVIITHYYWYLR